MGIGQDPRSGRRLLAHHVGWRQKSWNRYDHGNFVSGILINTIKRSLRLLEVHVLRFVC